MGDWLPKDPATIAEIGGGALGALGGAGLLGKFWDSLWAWRHKKLDHAKDIQALVDDRLRTMLEADDRRVRILLEADDRRLTQMSDAIAGQSKEIEALREETASLKGMVKTLVSHIASLESILRAKRLDVPPRPVIPVEGGA